MPDLASDRSPSPRGHRLLDRVYYRHDDRRSTTFSGISQEQKNPGKSAGIEVYLGEEQKQRKMLKECSLLFEDIGVKFRYKNSDALEALICGY